MSQQRLSFVLLATAALCLGSVISVAQTPSADDKPNYSGRWRMVKEKSEFAGFKTPDIVVRVVDHRDAILNVHTVQTTGAKTSTSDVSYNTDGVVSQNVVNGRDAESKCFWDGPVLVVRTSMKNSKGDDERIEDRWALSADRETLTIASHITTDKGEVDMTLVSARENPGK